MSSRTKIIIMKKREVIYTAIFAALGITLLILLFLMFRPQKDTSPQAARTSAYVPGVYSTPVTLNNNVMDLQVIVDADHINGIQLVTLSETSAAMFPLMQPALDKIAVQVCETQSTKDIYYEASSQYTSQMLLQAIDTALEIAAR